MTEANGNQDRARVLEKIKKLLAVARDGRGNVTEAETAARQASALMRKYNIENFEAIKDELNTDEAIVEEACRGGMTTHKTARSSTPEWCGYLAVGCAKLFDCFAFNRHGAASYIIFAGMKADAQVASWTYDYLVDQVTKGSKEHTKRCKANGDYRSLADARTRQRSFRIGMAIEIQRRLLELKKQQLGEAIEGQNALVVLKEQKIKDRYNLDYAKDKKQMKLDPSAYGRGVEEGKKTRLTPNPITNQASTNQQGLLK